MAQYEVKKVPLIDKEKKVNLKVGDIVERRVKDVEAFKKKYGNGYLIRVEEEKKVESPKEEK